MALQGAASSEPARSRGTTDLEGAHLASRWSWSWSRPRALAAGRCRRLSLLIAQVLGRLGPQAAPPEPPRGRAGSSPRAPVITGLSGVDPLEQTVQGPGLAQPPSHIAPVDGPVPLLSRPQSASVLPSGLTQTIEHALGQDPVADLHPGDGPGGPVGHDRRPGAPTGWCGLRTAASCRARRQVPGPDPSARRCAPGAPPGSGPRPPPRPQPGPPATGTARPYRRPRIGPPPHRLHRPLGGGGASIRTSCFSGRPWGSRPATDTDPGSRSASPRPADARSQRSSHHRAHGNYKDTENPSPHPQ